MIDIFTSILGVYLFIFLGFIAKTIFKEKVDEKSLVIVSIYFLQPIMAFWGLTLQKLNFTSFKAPLLYAFVIILALIFAIIFSRLFFKDQKDRSIAVVTSIIGNTGNLGIPLGIAIFSQESVFYTSLINLANVFFVYTVGVYFYSRGNFSIVDSLKNIIKLPVIWFAIFAIIFNMSGFSVPKNLLLPLEMGAYATMVLQLMIFGMYLYSIKLKVIEMKLFYFVSFMKFLFIPILGVLLLNFFDISKLMYGVVLVQLAVPLAVMNVNLASLYECKPIYVAFLTFSTSAVFLFYIFGLVYLFNW